MEFLPELRRGNGGKIMTRLTDKRYTKYREFNSEELWTTLPFLPTLREIYLKLTEYENREEKKQNKGGK